MKNLFLVCAILMIALFLSGCPKQKASQPTEQPPTVSLPEPKPAPKAVMVLGVTAFEACSPPIMGDMYSRGYIGARAYAKISNEGDGNYVFDKLIEEFYDGSDFAGKSVVFFEDKVTLEEHRGEQIIVGNFLVEEKMRIGERQFRVFYAWKQDPDLSLQDKKVITVKPGCTLDFPIKCANSYFGEDLSDPDLRIKVTIKYKGAIVDSFPVPINTN